MGKEQFNVVKGTRDFGPQQVRERQYIIQAIKQVFEKFGFQPLETPTMERLSVLTGKYGDEGDELLFRILNSGEFLKPTSQDDYNNGEKALSGKIAEKGLRYDLTVPFARYVTNNRNDLAFPFKRYQIQPVWRADKPQRGRYREFYQCDADVIGTNSLLCEAEVILMINEVLTTLGINDFTIKLNNRKILEGICDVSGTSEQFTNVVVAIDKLDKIGKEKVSEELMSKGISSDQANQIFELIEGDINTLKVAFENSEVGTKGIEEIEEVFSYLPQENNTNFDIALARGLSYYTGCIYEVAVNNVKIGSISGGGRYDNLTGGFGMEGVSGVGFSFGLDRIYDVLSELELFPNLEASSTKVIMIAFDQESFKYSVPVLGQLRAAGIKSELYPDVVKMKKSMKYANNRNIPNVILIGGNEMETGLLTLKNMITGEQENLSIPKIIEKLQE